MMKFSKILRIKQIEYFFQNQVEKYNKKETYYYGFFFGRSNWNSSIIPCNIYGKPKLMKFENLLLPVPERTPQYLTMMFGNYMELPPKNKRVGLHITHVDFGKY